MTDPSGGDSMPTGRLTFRTVWGGPSPQAGFIEEVTRMKQHLRTVEFSYHLDLFLMVGGEITPVPGPSGLRTPRVFLSRRTATGEIRISNDDVSAAAAPIAFLRQTIHRAVADLMSRVAARDPAFDADAEQAKFAFLIDEAATPDA
ncbi:hypothetical protein CQ045_17250 [Microbacterium sp. MYb66]|nr:hypothetical protein CQ045_17250 [Microbacterium sp. MYb66]